MLTLDNLSCGYGPMRAVSDLNLKVEEGTVQALLGPNGAGKTSTIMAIMGHVDIHGGRITFQDQDLTRSPAVKRVKQGIALVPEGRHLFPDLTVDENLTVGGYSLSVANDTENRARVFQLFPRLAERRRQMAGSLSGGEQQMLALGRALMAEPKFLLVDELSLGLMPKMVDLCYEALMSLKKDGLTILLVEQNTSRALEVSDNVCILASGAMIYQGSASDAARNTSLFETYLGVAC